MPERKMNPPVFLGSSAIIAAFLILGIALPGQAEDLFSAIQSWIIDTFGWLYILSVAGFVFAVLFLAFSRYERLKLGPDESEPDYSYLSWIAMLFAAGMGIGLMYFAVAEPIAQPDRKGSEFPSP